MQDGASGATDHSVVLPTVEQVLAGYLRETAFRVSPGTVWPTAQRAGTTLRVVARAATALGDHARAGRALRQAQGLDLRALSHPSDLDAFLTRSPAFALGWAEPPWQDPRLPFWQGEPRPVAPVVLLSAGGLGDDIQFLRWLPHIVARAGRVVVTVERPLARLARALPGVERVADSGTLAFGDAGAVRVANLALGPVLADATAAAIPPPPYLRPDPALVAGWRSALDTTRPGLRVGLVWSAAPRGSADPLQRTIGLRAMAPLGQIRGVTFFGIQKTTASWRAASGSAPAELEPAPPGLALVRLGGRFRDLADTAAALACLDLLITVDTATAHLAGAMGVPVWMLLCRPADPRWALGRAGERTPWYPSMRIFQQAVPGDWAPVVARVEHALRGLAGP